MRKIKILLGAYVDSVNAQNINCYNIAKNLDKTQFEVHTLYHRQKVFDSNSVIEHKISDNRFFKNIEKFLLLMFSAYDIIYLPRCEKVDLKFASMFKRKKCIISSFEIESLFHNKELCTFFQDTFDSFAISKELQFSGQKLFKRPVSLLYLGCDHLFTADQIQPKQKLKRIIYVGSVIERKRPLLFANLAEKFPQIQFIMVGDGNQLERVKEYIKKHRIANLETKGHLDNKEVYEELKHSDLLLMTSESEGLPKVILEAASMGVPSIYFNKLYHVDYIKNGYNGFGVKDMNEMITTIQKLINHPELLADMSIQSYKESQKYDWKILIHDYEKYFTKVFLDYSHIRR